MKKRESERQTDRQTEREGWGRGGERALEDKHGEGAREYARRVRGAQGRKSI